MLKLEVEEQLNRMEALYNLDIRNLDKIKIMEYKEYEIRSSINATAMESNRYL